MSSSQWIILQDVFLLIIRQIKTFFSFLMLETLFDFKSNLLKKIKIKKNKSRLLTLGLIKWAAGSPQENELFCPPL